MPAGLSYGSYFKMVFVAIISMAAGSQLVHQYYEPLSDLEEYVEREIQRRKSENGNDKVSKQ